MAVAAAATAPLVASPVLYDVLLLHGTPVERVEHLPAGLGEGDSVWVEGEQWTVAAVRDAGRRQQLVCIRNL